MNALPKGEESFPDSARRLGYPVLNCPSDFQRQWFEGEQAAFEENPDSCPYRIGSELAFWWQQGFDAGQAVTAALDDRG